MASIASPKRNSLPRKKTAHLRYYPCPHARVHHVGVAGLALSALPIDPAAPDAVPLPSGQEANRNSRPRLSSRRRNRARLQ